MHFTEEDLAFHQRLGHLLELTESEGFWPAFAAFLRESVGFESWVVLIFRKTHSPLLVQEGDTDDIEDELFGNYLRTFFTDDPFYRFAMGPFSSGVYRLDEVAYPQFRLSTYFHDYFRHNVVGDEIQLLTSFKEGNESRGVLSLSLGSRQRFSARDYGLLAIISPWVLPLLRLATRYTLGDIRMPADQSTRSNIEKKLRELVEPRLTEREIQTAQLLLSGQSTKGIAAHMGISPETAKVHRRNLYEKLGITSQAEIFARFSSFDG